MDKLGGAHNVVDTWRQDRSEEGKKSQAFRIDPDIKDRLDEICDEEDIAKSTLFRQLVRDFLSQHTVYSDHRGVKEALAVSMLEDIKEMYDDRDEVVALLQQVLKNIDSFRD